ncbi:hypothetical protein VPD39_22035, partial [Burkholderia vietnamiensis]|nr:hypothetical protein [Burkholderia vietnamiensis]
EVTIVEGRSGGRRDGAIVRNGEQYRGKAGAWAEYIVKLGRPVSLNDHPDIRRVFDGFHIETVPIQYTVGGGRGVERNELIIFSWDDAAQPAGLF